MLHYVTTSRSARIVVTPLHESPGPATAGASLFWTPDSRPVRAEDGPSANLAKQGVRYYRQRYRQPDARQRPVALRPMSKARVTARRPPKRCSASHRRVFWARFARGQIAKASSDFAKHDKARSGMGERTPSSTPKLGAYAHPRFSAVDQNGKLGKMPPFGTTSGAHPDKPKERPDAQSHAHPCDRTAVRRIGGPHRRRANLARGQ